MWQDTKGIQDQANTFFRHSDLRNSTRQEAPPVGSGIFNSSTTPKTNNNTTTKACKAWNYTGACDCEKDAINYKDHHRCCVCRVDHAMLHCPKRRSPIPASPQRQQTVNDPGHSNVLTRTGHGHEFWTRFNISAVVTSTRFSTFRTKCFWCKSFSTNVTAYRCLANSFSR